MSTESPSVPASSPTQYGTASVQHAQTPNNHGTAPPMHGHASGGLASGAEAHVGHNSNTGMYPENVQPAPHHMAAGSFSGAQLSPMASPYGAYGAAQYPMYGGSYSGHAYPPYPNYMGHISHYGHPPHYPGASSTPAYHNQMMSNMVHHSGYSPHGATHMPSHHAQNGLPLSMGNSVGAGGLPVGPGGPMGSSAVVQTPSYSSAPQYSTQLPMAGRHRVTTTLWEDEGTLCFQVDVKGVCVARRHDNNMVNGTKLLNVCGMSRGKRDGILKNEKERIVVKVGAMHLKGVWIAFNRGKQLAEQHGIAEALYPLFEPNIQSFLYHPDNYPRTAAVMAAAQERHVQRHYAGQAAGNGSMKEVGADMAPNMPLHAGLENNQWGAAQQQQPPCHDQSNTGNEAGLHYQQYQHYPHHQHHTGMIPPPAGPGMFGSASGHYSQNIPQPVRLAAPGMGIDRRAEHAAEPHPHAPSTPNGMQSGANGTHRRVSGMKRSNDDYETGAPDNGHQDQEQTSQQASNSTNGANLASVPPATSQGSADTFSGNGFNAQSFALDDNMKMMKRPKVSDSLSSQNHATIASVYPGEHAQESDTRTPSHAEVR